MFLRICLGVVWVFFGFLFLLEVFFGVLFWVLFGGLFWDLLGVFWESFFFSGFFGGLGDPFEGIFGILFFLEGLFVSLGVLGLSLGLHPQIVKRNCIFREL